MRFNQQHRPLPREITTRRLAAAERFLQKERDKFPLLTDWIAAQQPTAIERIENHNLLRMNHQQKIRDSTANTWREARKELYSLPKDVRQQILEKWNNSRIPADAWYFADFLTREAEKICPGLIKSRPEKYQELLLKYRQIQAAKLKIIQK